MVKIIYSEYAEDSIKDRKIRKIDIENTILNPDEIVEGRKERKIAHKIINKKLLRVVYEITEKAYIVVTAYYTEPKRYMKWK